MKIYRIRSFEEYHEHRRSMQAEYSFRHTYEKSLLPRWRKKFKIKGYSYPAGKTVNFKVDYKHKRKEGLPNWRERLACPISGLNNRMRASVHIFDVECAPYRRDPIFITEQVTALYKYFSTHFDNVTGSEFVGEEYASGTVTPYGIRHEDLTSLSFPNDSFKNLLTFDCLEHIPDYSKALRECWRVLRQEGNMLFSVPFDLMSQKNITRARLSTGGMVDYIMEPEYHGDPMKKSGCLCYRHYGWEMLDELKTAGFKDVYAVFYWSKEFGYLGGEQVLFIAKK